jgi:hypothetical protein
MKVATNPGIRAVEVVLVVGKVLFAFSCSLLLLQHIQGAAVCHVMEWTVCLCLSRQDFFFVGDMVMSFMSQSLTHFII